MCQSDPTLISSFISGAERGALGPARCWHRCLKTAIREMQACWCHVCASLLLFLIQHQASVESRRTQGWIPLQLRLSLSLYLSLWPAADIIIHFYFRGTTFKGDETIKCFIGGVWTCDGISGFEAHFLSASESKCLSEICIQFSDVKLDFVINLRAVMQRRAASEQTMLFVPPVAAVCSPLASVSLCEEEVKHSRNFLDASHDENGNCDAHCREKNVFTLLQSLSSIHSPSCSALCFHAWPSFPWCLHLYFSIWFDSKSKETTQTFNNEGHRSKQV